MCIRDSNSTFDGVLKMHEAMFNTHDCVNRLPLFTTVPDDPPPHGQWFDNNRYCVCCDAEFDGFNHPLECPQCAAPWEREASES